MRVSRRGVESTDSPVNGRISLVNKLSDDDVLAWRDLASHAVQPNPLYEAECLIPSARYFSNGGEIALVVAEEGGRFFGCFPVAWVAGNVRPSITWPGIRRPSFSTQVRRLDYDGTPLLREERGVETAVTLLSVLRRRDLDQAADVLVFEALDADGPVASFIAAAAEQLKVPIHTYRTWTRPLVRRREEPTYRSSSDYQSDRKIAKLRRQLGEKLGGEVAIVDRGDDAAALEQVISLEAAGYKLKAGVAMMAHPGEAEWFREMCAQFRAEHRLHLYCLQVGDSVIAMQLMVRGGEGLFGLQTIFDEGFAKYSPGIILHDELLDRFHHETDAQWHDTCTYAGNETLLRLYPDRRSVSTVLVAVGGPVARNYFRLYASVQELLGVDSAFRRRHPRLCGALDSALSKLGMRPRYNAP
jgi:CelD/BcsL family acetyltransferase involved in cellulose biosynthesis